VVKEFSQKAASPSSHPSQQRMHSSNLNPMVGLHESAPKRHVDRFSMFVRITQQRLAPNLVCISLIISEILFCLNFYWRPGNRAKVYNTWSPSSIGRTWSTWLQGRPRNSAQRRPQTSSKVAQLFVSSESTRSPISALAELLL